MADYDDLSTGDLVTVSAHINDWQRLRRLLAGGTLLDNLSDGAELADSLKAPVNAADYDSGWFSVSNDVTYAKAHGLSSAPLRAIVWWATSATPTNWYVVYVVANSSVSSTLSILSDATNITVHTGANSTLGTYWGTTRTSASGYYRILAWEN